MQLTSNSPNHFLASLSNNDRELVSAHLKPFDLPLHAVFFKTEGTIERVYFPHSGIVSLVVGLSGGQFVEAGVLGRTASSALAPRWTARSRSTPPSGRPQAREP